MHQRFTTPIAIVLLFSVGLACSFLRPKGQLTWHVMLQIDAPAAERDAAVKRTVDVIERRLDAFGIYNAKVQAQGTPADGRILVSLPNVRDRERVTKLITAIGRLELTAVVSPPSPQLAKAYSTKEEALASLGGMVPENRRVLPYVERAEPPTGEQGSEESRPGKQWVVVESPSIVDGRELRDAQAFQSSGGDDAYQISFSLKPEGAAKFGEWTGAHINDYIGVVLNGEVKSIAYIRSQITDQGEISGRFTKQSAEDLALILRAGALPAPVRIIETADNN